MRSKTFRQKISIFAMLTFLFTNLLGYVLPMTVRAANATDLFISEYIEGSSNNKAIEIFNGTGSAVNLSEYTVELYSNGNTAANNTCTLEGTLENGQVFVIANSSAVQAIKDKANMESTITYFNGDDALVLKHNGAVIDSFGKVGEDPGTAWTSGEVTTSNKTLVRKSSVTSGDKITDDNFDPALEWDVYAQDTVDYLGFHKMDTGAVSDIISIEEARKQAKDTEVTVEGIVTFVEKNTLMYIQDSTAGVKIDTYSYSVDLSSYKPGDKVKATGLIDFYKDELEISVEKVENLTLESSDNTMPQPKVVKINDLQQVQGQLVKVEMAKLTDVTTDKYSFFIEDETGSTKLYYTPAKNFIKEDYKANEFYNITGIAAKYYDSQLKLRDGSDMEKQVTPQNPEVKLPLITKLSPSNMESIDNCKPTISATIEKGEAEVDMTSLKMYVDDVEVNPEITDMQASYTPNSDLAYGEHDVKIEVSDLNGQLQSLSWFFIIVKSNTNYNFYYGVPHSHTAYSDGKDTPTDAFNHAIENGLDYLFITDHSNWFDGVKGEGKEPNYEYNKDTDQYEEVEGSEWYKTRIEAEEFNTKHSDFLALRGFEMTSGTWGHLNVINSDNYVEAKQQMPQLDKFYEWLLKQPNTIGSFNHPNWPDDSFNDLAYVPELDRVINTIEVGNGAPPYSYARAEYHYFKALDNGWHVGAINGQDNHSENWGDPDNLTVIIAENLDEASFIDALRNRRVYSTETRTLKLTFKADGKWMGSIINKKAGETLNFNVIAEDSEVPIKELQLITNGGKILDSKKVSSSNKVEWNPSVKVGGGAEWYVVKVIHENGKWGTSSPIFTPSAENDVKLTSLKVDPDTTMPGYETKIEAVVSNMGIRDANNIEVKFYKNSVSEDNLIGSGTANTLRAKDNVAISTTWTPTESGPIKIIAKLTEIPNVTTVTEITTTVKVVASNNKTIMIDKAHDNADVMGAMLNITDLLRRYGYTTIINENPITAESLKNIDVLIINAVMESKNFTDVEEKAISDWVNAGGSLLISSKSNFSYDSTAMNSLMSKIGTKIRFNNDNIYEPEDSDKYSGGMVWSVYSYNLPHTQSGLNDNMEAIRIFSGCSLINDKGKALVNNEATGLEILLGANNTSYNENAKEGAYVYNNKGELNGEAIPIIAKENIGDGKIVAAGRHFYSDFEIVNDASNTALTLNIIDYLAEVDRIKTIKDVRENCKEGDIVTVKGTVTSPTDNFFDAMYIQDDTSGVCIYGSQQGDLTVGTEVIATGVVHYFEGELEIAFDNFKYEVLYVGPVSEQIKPIKLSTKDTMNSNYTGMLVTTEGIVKEYSEAGSYFKIDDGSGLSYIHVDGYIGADMSRVEIGDKVQITGISSIGAAGPRIRVRFYDDIKIIEKDANEPNDPNDDEDMVYDITDNSIVDKDIFNKIKGLDKNITFVGDKITWIFNGKDIKALVNEDIDLSLKEVSDKLKQKEIAIIKAVFGKELPLVAFSFSHDGKLPGLAKVKVFIGEDWIEKTVYLCRYYTDKNNYEIVTEGVIDEEGYLTFEIDHCSDYFIIEKTSEINLPKTGSPIDLTVLLIIGLLLTLVGVSIIFIKKKQ